MLKLSVLHGSVCLGAAALLASSPLVANNASQEPKDSTSFSAVYRLKGTALPRAKVVHELSRNEDRVESDMRGSTLALASGSERSHFLHQGKVLTGLFYTSSYGVPGYRKNYQLSLMDLDGKPDRQMMLYQLSLDAISGHCTVELSCQLEYVDHRGRNKSIKYHQHEHPEPIRPDLVRYPVSLMVTEEGRSTPLLMSFHPEHPGLILEAEMWRDDDSPYRLVLRDVVFD